MTSFFKSNFKKLTVVIALTPITFLSIQTNYFQVFLINDSLAAAGYQYAFPADVCKTGVKNVEDVFGKELNGKNVPYSRIKISQANTNIYAFTTGVVTKVEKIADKASLWLNGDDGYNYYYSNLSEVNIAEEAVKVGDLIGKAENGYVYFAVTRGGYQTVLDEGGLKSKEDFRKVKTRTEKGLRTERYLKTDVELFNPTPIFNSATVIRQCSETPNPTVTLGKSSVSSADKVGTVTVRATITDPGDKNVTVEFRIRKQGELTDQSLQVSDIHKKTWPPEKWRASGSSFAYTFSGLEPGLYEWSARGMNADGVYSHGVTFGLEDLKTEKVSYNVALAQTQSPQVVSDGYAPAQAVAVDNVSTTSEVVYHDTFDEPGLKVGSDDKGDCCYGVFPSSDTIKITPDTGKYSIYIVAAIPRGYTGDREVTIYDGVVDASKTPVVHGGDRTTSYYRIGQNNYTRNQFVYWIDSSQSPWNQKEHNIRIKIKNPEDVNSINPLYNNADATFFVKEVLVTRPLQSSTPTTNTTVPITSLTTLTTTPPTTMNTTPLATIVTTPTEPSSCPTAFNRSKLSVYESSGETDTCSTGRTAGPGSCYVKTYCKDIGWISGAEGKDLAKSIGALGQSSGIAGNRDAVDNLIRSEIAVQFSDLTSDNRALAQKVMLSYAFLENNSYYKFFTANGSPIYYCDSSKAGCALDYFSLTTDKFCTKKKKVAASYDIKYATYLAVKEFRSVYSGKRPTTLTGWKEVVDIVFSSSFWTKSWGYSPNHAAYLSSGKYANEQPYSCVVEKPNNPPTISTVDVAASTDIVALATGTSNVTLRAVAPDPDGNQTSVKFRIYKYDTQGLTPQEYCSTMKESGDFDALQASGTPHQYTFTGLAPGTYKWSAIARDENFRTSEGGNMFCYSSNDVTKPLYGFAYPKTFTVTQSGTVEINHRPYVKPAEMSAVANPEGTSVSLTTNGYDDDADKVNLYYRVREKITGNCVYGSGISSFTDSGWTGLKPSGSPSPVTVGGLKLGTSYQWSVKAQDEHGMTSKYTADPQVGLSFCGGSEWYPSLEFTTPNVVVPGTTTSTTIGNNPSCAFNANLYTIAPGSSVSLAYNTANATTAEICSSGGTCKTTTVGANQTFTATPTANTNYTLTVKNTAGTAGTCTTTVNVSSSSSTSTTSTTIPGGFARLFNWDYCKDSRYTTTDCINDMVLGSSAIPIHDPQALDVAHRLNAFFIDGLGTIMEAPKASVSLDPGNYEVWVYAASESLTQTRTVLAIDVVSGTTIATQKVVIVEATSALTYGKYKLRFSLATKKDVRFKFVNDTAGRVFVDRLSLFKAQ